MIYKKKGAVVTPRPVENRELPVYFCSSVLKQRSVMMGRWSEV